MEWYLVKQRDNFTSFGRYLYEGCCRWKLKTEVLVRVCTYSIRKLSKTDMKLLSTNFIKNFCRLYLGICLEVVIVRTSRDLPINYLYI
jgi:hypothetical protein